MNNNYVRITNDKGQEVVCDNFSYEIKQQAKKQKG